MRTIHCFTLIATLALVGGVADADNNVLPSVQQRYKSLDTDETPNFQKHVSPLLGRLGCNGRACHGSFQGRGGFQLSLFGYDFKADHEALLDKESTRVDMEDPLESLILTKPVDADLHEGGVRYETGTWQHHVLQKWILDGARFEETEVEKMVKLTVEPAEIIFRKANEKIQLRAIAVWPDGTREDVTPLCRFQTNDDQVADIDEHGLVTATKPGDTNVVVFYDNGVVPIPVMQPISNQVGSRYPQVAAKTKIDKHVVNKLRKLGVVPSDVCSDAEFLRRVSLDLTGTLPSTEEVTAFLKNKSPNKRKAKIDELLETPAYAAWWTTRLCDYTGNNASKLRNVSPVQQAPPKFWYRWIHDRVEQNVSYDKIVEGIVTAVSRQEDQSYRDYSELMTNVHKDLSGEEFAKLESMPYYWARQDFTQPEERAIGFAYAFLGVRIQCAQCHKHPFDQWTKDDFEQFKTFFSYVSRGNTQNRDKETRAEYDKMIAALGLGEVRGGQLRRELANVIKDGKTVPFPEVHLMPTRTVVKSRGKTQVRTKTARLLGDEEIDLSKFEDPRVAVMDWMRKEGNMAKAFVNRVWANYFHRGIVEPPDDLSMANPPVNAELLHYLTASFMDNDYDMKWLHREICNSDTYQRSWKSNETNSGDSKNFSRAVPRRLPAEVTYDALIAAVSSDATVAGMRERSSQRAISLAEVGNYRRNANSFALQVFGQSTRDSNCDCDRSAEPSLLQTVYLQNDTEVLTKIEGAKDSWIKQVADELGIKISVASSAKPPKNWETTYASMKRQYANLVKKGDNARAKTLRQRLKTLVARYGKPAGALDEEDAKADALAAKKSAAKIKEYATEAYLRTLSRYPTDDELAKSEAYITAAKNPVDGLRGLLWALINTKEFIVNH